MAEKRDHDQNPPEFGDGVYLHLEDVDKAVEETSKTSAQCDPRNVQAAQSEFAARANDGKIELGRVLDFKYAIAEFAKVCTFGDEKYTRITGEPARYNWRKGFPLSQLMNSTMRHLQAHHSGEDRDPETGCLHVAHAMWNCAAMCEMLIGDSPAGDDSYARFDDRLEVK